MTITWTNETRKLSELIHWPRNPRQIKGKQAERLAESVQEFGQVETLAIGPSNELYNGHQRANVLAEKHGLDYEVEVRVASRELTEKEREKLTVYLHQGATGEWDFDTLANEFEIDELLEWGFDDSPMAEMLEGFSVGDANEGEDTEPQISKAEELRQKYGVEFGQLWQLGNHRIICGDCTDGDVVDRLMDGQIAEISFTSPPYLDMRTYSGNDLSLDTLLEFIPLCAKISKYAIINLGMKFQDGAVVSYWDRYIDKFAQSKYKLLAWNVWDKTMSGTIASATNMFLLTHEWLFVFGENRKKLNRTIPNQLEKYARRHGKHFLDGIEVSFRQENDEMALTTSATYTHHQLHSVIQQTPELGGIRQDHPATFPIGLPSQYIEAMTDNGNIVFEPFSGSGTTIIACENLGRQCRAIEIDPGYVAVTIHRWEQHTGGKAELISTNTTV